MINFSTLLGNIVDKCIHLCSQWIMYANTLENFMKIERCDFGSDTRHNIQTINVAAKIGSQFILFPVHVASVVCRPSLSVVSVSLAKCYALTIIFLFTLDQFLYPSKCFSRHQSSLAHFILSYGQMIHRQSSGISNYVWHRCRARSFHSNYLRPRR